MGLELRTKVKKIMFPCFYFIEILAKIFSKHSRHLACWDVVDFLLKSDMKHQ